MKRFALLLFILLFLLSGCGDSSGQTATPDTPESLPQVTEPETFAAEEVAADLSAETGNAVKCYRIENADYYAMCPMGDGAVLFSGKTETTLTYVTNDNQPIHVTLAGIFITPDLPGVQASQEGISYYAPDTHSLVFLNPQLRVTSRIPLTKDIPANPLLSKDWKLIYYYSEGALRCMDLRSGISRLLKQSDAQDYQLGRLLFDGRVVECRVMEGMQMKTLLISTENGETLFSASQPLMLLTEGERYLAQWMDGNQRLWLTGSREASTVRLQPLWEDGAIWRLNGNCLTACRGREDGIQLAWYDLLQDGSYASVQIRRVDLPVGICADEETAVQWILTREQGTQSFRLYAWAPTLSKGQETLQTIVPYYTVDSPDQEGLDRCEAMVEPLQEEYGLEIRMWQEGVQVPSQDYLLTPEHSVEAYETYLPTLEKAIRAYPEDIFKKIGKKSANKKLTIALVREIIGRDELGSPTQEQGVYFIHDGSVYLILTVSEQIEATFYHQLFHAMDSYILVEAKTYDEWGRLNPEGFAYDNSYLLNETRDPKNYLEEETRAFIDLYSMSYPKEDRATIMEYAMQPGMEAYFTSSIMQKKLDTLCNGIRKAFRLKDEEGSLPWEQYLTVSFIP